MNKTKLTLCSLFDGSGGFSLGAILAGIEPIASSEIEPFPILVTHKRLPQPPGRLCCTQFPISMKTVILRIITH